MDNRQESGPVREAGEVPTCCVCHKPLIDAEERSFGFHLGECEMLAVES